MSSTDTEETCDRSFYHAGSDSLVFFDDDHPVEPSEITADDDGDATNEISTVSPQLRPTERLSSPSDNNVDDFLHLSSSTNGITGHHNSQTESNLNGNSNAIAPRQVSDSFNNTEALQSTDENIAINTIERDGNKTFDQEKESEIFSDNVVAKGTDNDASELESTNKEVSEISRSNEASSILPNITESTDYNSVFLLSEGIDKKKPSKQHRHVTTAEENIAVEALASLSTNIAEMTLSEHDNMNSDNMDNIVNDPTVQLVNVNQSDPITRQEQNRRTGRENDQDKRRYDDYSSRKYIVSPFEYNRDIASETKVLAPSSTPNVIGADQLSLLHRIDENRFDRNQIAATAGFARTHPPLGISPNAGMAALARHENGKIDLHPSRSGRRKIQLRLQEETFNSSAGKKRHMRSTSLLGTLRNSSTRMLRFRGGSATTYDSDDFDISLPTKFYSTVDRGTITIGWFDGTSSLELQQHIQNSVLRKLQKADATITGLDDLRILDDRFNPPEDVVLSVHIPDGSQFLLRFGTIKTTTAKKDFRSRMEYDGNITPMSIYSGRAPDSPDSPSAFISPNLYKKVLRRLNANQLARLNSIEVPEQKTNEHQLQSATAQEPDSDKARGVSTDGNPAEVVDSRRDSITPTRNDDEDSDDRRNTTDKNHPLSVEESSDDDADTIMFHSDDPIEARLREITNLLLLDRRKERRRYDRQREKQQVVFVVANYFVLFLAIIAISAELQARAPTWIKRMEQHLQNVQNCSENHEALFECISRGDFAGLIASIFLWLSRSVTTKRIFLFGFDSAQKLWTVVYESLVTSVCWGISYLFIRRGMNPDTRPNFVQKYWKDAVYGSLAGFNAAFLKHILKNLIPEQVVQDALRDRQLKIMGWLPSFKFR